MGIVYLAETAASGKWDHSYSKVFRQQDYKRERRWVKEFICQVDTTAEDPDTTLTNCQNSGLLFAANFQSSYAFPNQDDPHPLDSDMKAREFRVRVAGGDEGAAVRYVEVVYELSTDPTTERPVVQWDTNSYQWVIPGAYVPPPPQVPLNPDAQGYQPLVNTAGDTFNPPPVWQEPYRVLKITKNFTLNAWATMEQAFVNVTGVVPNNVLVTNLTDYVVTLADGLTKITYPAGTMLMDTMPSGQTDRRNNIDFVRASFMFKTRWRGWLLSLLNAGFNKLASNGTVSKPIYVGGRPAANPVLLAYADANGNVSELNPPGQAVSPPIYLRYTVYGTYDFANFGLFS